jgi:branched-chain amino acid transport system substrate-binding protein
MTFAQSILSRHKRAATVIVAGIAAASVLAACSSSKSGGSSSPGSGQNAGSGPIKIGVLGSFSGSAAPGFADLEKGVKARLGVANAAGGINGRQIEYVLGDNQSTPQGEAAAVNKLVQQDKVAAIVEVSSYFFGGYKNAVKAGVPVFGTGFDGGPEWQDQSNTNLFDVTGVGDYTLVATTYGLIAKKLGVTKMGGLSYTTSPSATLSVKEYIASAQAAGLQAGYSKGVDFGTTDVGPVVLGIKSTGTDGFYMSTIPNTAFAVAAGLAQQNLKLKATLLATGYGADLLNNKAAVQAAQGLQFLVATTPVELKTPGTLAMQAGLSKYAGFPADVVPSFSATEAWLATDALVWGLNNAKDDPSSKNIIAKSRNATWDAAGLTKPLDFGTYTGLAGAGLSSGNCTNVVTLEGTKFVPEPGLTPICGDIIEGKKVSA